ncbi:MAG: sigma-70 family RNA polymerase sigma factor [Planctomycetia bacterium]
MNADSATTPDADGDPRGHFVMLLTAAHDRLLGYLLSLLGRRHDAEDVLQKASLTMWRKFDAFEPGTDFLAWASTICFYEAKNFQRLAARSPHCFEESLLALLAAERVADLRHQPARLAALEQCLEELPGKDRELLDSVYVHGVPIAELARAIDRAPQTLYNRLNTLRRLLAECVERRLAAS